MLDGLKARLEQLLHNVSPDDPRARAAGLREALLEGKAGLTAMRDALETTARELEAERRQLVDAERRGRLASEVPDADTVAVAERFAARHRERIVVLERKLGVQRDELALAEREVEEISAEFRRARLGADRQPRSGAKAEADLDAELGLRRPPPTRAEDEHLRERTVEAQLAYLKKKLGKQ
ncbi:MAG: hypothetical protein H0W67_02485 [Gemmatimonadales bacterium]|nr:hypothetical protein [Gemmatimonadales bacterium]